MPYGDNDVTNVGHLSASTDTVATVKWNAEENQDVAGDGAIQFARMPPRRIPMKANASANTRTAVKLTNLATGSCGCRCGAGLLATVVTLPRLNVRTLVPILRDIPASM